MNISIIMAVIAACQLTGTTSPSVVVLKNQKVCQAQLMYCMKDKSDTITLGNCLISTQQEKLHEQN